MSQLKSINDYLNISLQQIKTTSRHFHNGLEFLLIIKGNLQLELEGKVISLNSSDIILINRKHIHNITGTQNNLVIRLYIEKAFLENNCSEILNFEYNCNSGSVNEFEQHKYIPIKQIIAQVMLLHIKKDEAFLLEIMSNIYKLMMHIFKHFRNSKDNSNDQNINKDFRLKRILTYINDNFTTNIKLGDIAKNEYLSIHYLSKYFKQQVGVNFYEYLNDLRLGQAIMQLLYSDMPIIKIALNSGFPNAKSFNKIFYKRFNKNPNDYRKENRQYFNNESISPGVIEMSSTDDNSLSELIKYIVLNDFNIRETVATSAPININFNNTCKTKSKKEKIIRIGKFEELFSDITKNQLIDLTQTLKEFKYIYFEDFFIENTFTISGNIVLGFNDIFYALDFINRLQLKPIAQINLDYFIHKFSGDSHSIETYIYNMISGKVNIITAQYGADYFDNWFFEIKGKNICEDFLYFKQTLNILQKYIENARIGVSLDRNLHDKGSIINIFRECKSKNINLEFVTFESDLNKDETMGTLEPNSYRLFDNYLNNQISTVRNLLKKYYKENTQIFVTSFNTLAGQDRELAAAFFRVAIILETLINIHGSDVSISFWLHINNDLDYGIMSIYLYRLIKRPIFFLLEFMCRMGFDEYFSNENIIANKNNNSYYIMVFNPSYLRPLYYIGSTYIKIENKKIAVSITGLKPGNYVIKKFILDRNNGSLYDMLIALDGMNYIDHETISYIEKTLSPSMTVMNRQVENEINIISNLTLNAVILYELKRI